MYMHSMWLFLSQDCQVSQTPVEGAQCYIQNRKYQATKLPRCVVQIIFFNQSFVFDQSFAMHLRYSSKKNACQYINVIKINKFPSALFYFIIYFILFSRHFKDHLQSFLVIGACFCDFSEFQAWKESLEDSEDCLFIKNTGPKRLGESKVEYFSCNCGGDYVTKGTGKRRLKSQGIGKQNL